MLKLIIEELSLDLNFKVTFEDDASLNEKQHLQFFNYFR